jgi:anti-anti-sigma factor
VSGRLDTNSAPQLQEALLPELESAKRLVLDFSSLDYISSSGLRVLLIGEKTAKEKSITLLLTHVSEEIMEIFDMTGFTNMLEIE